MNKNSLINMLPIETQEEFFYKSALVDLELSTIICSSESSIKFLYFPIDGFISLLQSIDSQQPLEVGMVGREGVLGSEALLGQNSHIFGAIVQGAGSAWKIELKEFLALTNKSQALKNLIKTYLAVRIAQLGLSAACEHFHEIGPRLAKWLLMSQDRAHSPTFLMTHEFISLMLGVRRVGITTVAADFRRRGLIQYHRGEMQILNRVALKEESCSCYRKNKKMYLSLFG